MFNFNPSGTSSFTPSWGASTSYNPSSNVLNSGGASGASGGGMDPLSMGLGLGSSLLNGVFSGMAAGQQAAATKYYADQQAQATRDAAFQNLLGGQWAMTSGQEYAQGLQRDAANYQQAFLDPRKSVLGVEDLNRKATFELGPLGKQLFQRQNVAELNLNAAKARSLTDAMFGETSRNPFAYGAMPGYALRS